MKKRNIIKIAMASILVFGTMSLGLIGCTTGNSSPGVTLADVNSRLATLEQWKSADFYNWATQVNNQIGERPTLSVVNSLVDDVSVPNLSNYATDAEVQTALDNFINNLTDSQIAALKTKLGLSTTSGTITPTTGTVTAEIVAGANVGVINKTNTLLVTSSASTTTYVFAVQIANGTNQYQYVSLSLSLVLQTSLTSPVVLSPAPPHANNQLSATGSVAYTTTPVPNNTAVTQIIYTPSSTPHTFGVAANSTIQVQFWLIIQTNTGAQWNGNLTGISFSTTWS